MISPTRLGKVSNKIIPLPLKIRHTVCQLSGVSTCFQVYCPCLYMAHQNTCVNGIYLIIVKVICIISLKILPLSKETHFIEHSFNDQSSRPSLAKGQNCLFPSNYLIGKRPKCSSPPFYMDPTIDLPDPHQTYINLPVH